MTRRRRRFEDSVVASPDLIPRLRRCDHCGADVHMDRNGWWVGPDNTSDCAANDRGHEVEGSTYV